MPIARHLRPLYSRDAGWPELRAAILARAGGACECTGQCGSHSDRCGAPDRAYIVRPGHARWRWRLAGDVVAAGERRVRVVLSVAHLDQNANNNDPGNLLAVCQRCHIVHDRAQHRRTRIAGDWARRVERGQLLLPGVAGG